MPRPLSRSQARTLSPSTGKSGPTPKDFELESGLPGPLAAGPGEGPHTGGSGQQYSSTAPSSELSASHLDPSRGPGFGPGKGNTVQVQAASASASGPGSEAVSVAQAAEPRKDVPRLRLVQFPPPTPGTSDTWPLTFPPPTPSLFLPRAAVALRLFQAALLSPPPRSPA
eukprot:2870290-Rhodomonas_salina.2